MSELLRIGTRKSPLALWQAEHVKARLMEAHPGLQVELCKVETRGDKILDVPLAQVGGKALFVKEIEEQLLKGEIDLAVHSMKDVPTQLPDELILSCTTERADARDAFVAKDPHATPTLADLREGARVGTSSLRRQVQLLALKPSLEIVPIRGNVGTRLSKLEDAARGVDGQPVLGLDAVLLAAAGLDRLELGHRITQRLPPSVMLPAIGQAALGLETRREDKRTRALVEVLHHPTTAACVAAERAFLTRLEGSCQVPIGGYATLGDDGQLSMRTLIGSLDGRQILRAAGGAPAAEAESLGVRLAEEQLAQGADVVLAEIFSAAP